MKTQFYSNETRGKADFGWLKANYSFSFANFYHPERLNFGALRVLNDDIIAGGAGFAKHPHDNMEIVTIPLKGALKHKDSTGEEGVIEAGDVQIMSAGTGIYHSEANGRTKEDSNTLQIWVFPKMKDIQPRYAQKRFDKEGRKNQFQRVISPNEPDALWINQDAYFSLGEFEAGQKATYSLHKGGQGVYIFLIEGNVEVAGHTLNSKDALGVWDTSEISIQVNQNSKILLIEVPMEL